jgi:hypothetical protein
VRVLVGLLARPPVAAALAAGGEKLLVDQAQTLTFAHWVRAVRYFEQVTDPDGSEEAAADVYERRYLHLSQLFDGTWRLDGELDPVGGAALHAALGRIDDQMFTADRSAATAALGRAAKAGDPSRSPAQRRADALVELAHRAAAAPPGGRRPRPLVSVLVDYETFAGRICELADGTVIAPGQVAALLDTALIERVVFDGPSRILDLGRARGFTGAVRRALEIRDRGCTFDGCDVPAHHCQGDHIHPWAQGGRTNEANGQLRCGYHNRWTGPDPPVAA